MLAYAFNVIGAKEYENIDSESFENTYNLFAAILSIGVSKQLKQGLYREYAEIHDSISTIRGKIDINQTILNKINSNRQIGCAFDEYSENNPLNQIIKVTLKVLLRSDAVNRKNKDNIRKLLPFFENVNDITARDIKWSAIVVPGNQRSYILLINICQFVLNNMLPTTQSGSIRFRAFGGDELSVLYEKFIFEYYRQTYPKYRVWLDMKSLNVDEENSDENILSFLPKYKTDVMILNPENKKLLIIDAKYYTHILTTNHDTQSIRNSHLNQIMVYVWNHIADGLYSKVEGMLMYAKTNDEKIESGKGRILGNDFHINVLDLNTSFQNIRKSLNNVMKLLGEC